MIFEKIIVNGETKQLTLKWNFVSGYLGVLSLPLTVKQSPNSNAVELIYYKNKIKVHPFHTHEYIHTYNPK